MKVIPLCTKLDIYNCIKTIDIDTTTSHKSCWLTHCIGDEIKNTLTINKEVPFSGIYSSVV